MEAKILLQTLIAQGDIQVVYGKSETYIKALDDLKTF